jgi:hypothetical protein
MVTLYRPFQTFLWMTAFFLVPGVLLLGRFFYFYFFTSGEATGHIQSVVVGGVLLVIAVQLFVLGILAELLAANRALIEDMLTRVKRKELE